MIFENVFPIFKFYMKSIDRKILILYTSFTKSKKQKHEKKQKEGETNQ